MRERSGKPRFTKGQADHIDAWLMSYADLITLMFMVFVIFVSVSNTRPSPSPSPAHGEPEHPYLQHRSGTLEIGTRYDEAYRVLAGIIASSQSDQHIALEKSDNGITLDMSMSRFFEPGTVTIPPEQTPILQDIAKALKDNMQDDSIIVVEGHTDDVPLPGSPFANDWELSAMRAARIASQLTYAGIEPARLRATGYAGTHPLVPNKDAHGAGIARNQERNQRIIIRLQGDPDRAKAATNP